MRWRQFQFTPLREGRRASARCVRPRHRHFNSRPSARGDRQGNPRWATETISIHAPPRGATAWSCLVCHHCYFNSHPSARGDTKRSLRVCVLLIFQFTPLREGRRSRGHFLLCDDYFNSRPSARGDLAGCDDAPSPKEFQFTPLREGRLEVQRTTCD